jgi:hypothetical protein
MSKEMMKKDPDKGPPMLEGAHHYDKGYESDHSYAQPEGAYPGSSERGNRYMMHQNEIVSRDGKKLERSKFSKIH